MQWNHLRDKHCGTAAATHRRAFYRLPWLVDLCETRVRSGARLWACRYRDSERDVPFDLFPDRDDAAALVSGFLF